MTDERIIEIEGSSTLMAEALALRQEVFVVEQGVPAELEIDELDPVARHLVAIRDGAVVGTLRILQDHGVAKIGRVAARAAQRRARLGSRLMEHAAALVLAEGHSEIVLHAQVSVAHFYRKLGY